jgi:hypothetical protein
MEYIDQPFLSTEKRELLVKAITEKLSPSRSEWLERKTDFELVALSRAPRAEQRRPKDAAL